VLEFLVGEIRKEKEIKGIQIGKEDVKLALLADDIILYLKDPKDSTKNHLGLVKTFCKVRYKLNIKKSVAFLYTKNEQIQKEIKKTIPFTIASKM
jgi:hypothetical protein